MMEGFTEFSEAFDFCREMNTAVRVIVGDLYKLYPSGRAELISETTEFPQEPEWVTEFSQLRLEELSKLSPDEEAAECGCYEPLFIWP